MAYTWDHGQFTIVASLGDEKRASARSRQRQCRLSAKQTSKALEAQLKEAHDRIKDLEQERDRFKASVQRLEEERARYQHFVDIVEQALPSTRPSKRLREDDTFDSATDQLASPASSLGHVLGQEPAIALAEQLHHDPPWLRLPAHVLPTCQLDDMLNDLESLGTHVASQNLYEEVFELSGSAMPLLPSPLPLAFSTDTSSPVSSTSEERGELVSPESQGAGSLLDLLQRGAERQDHPSSISSILLSHVGMAMTSRSMPVRLAGLFFFFSLARWHMVSSEQTFEQLPTFLIPTEKQVNIPHPRWIDILLWPEIRDKLIDNLPMLATGDQQRRFRSMLNRETELGWERPLEECVTATHTGHYTLSTVFKEHALNLENWSLGQGAYEEFTFLK